MARVIRFVTATVHPISTSLIRSEGAMPTAECATARHPLHKDATTAEDTPRSPSSPLGDGAWLHGWQRKVKGTPVYR